MSAQLDLFASAAARDAGIQKAVTHADQVEPGWTDRAYEMLLKFLSVHRGSFMTEEARTYATQLGLPEPPSNRAWGGVMLRALHKQLITKVDTRPVRNVKAHRANASVWRQTGRNHS